MRSSAIDEARNHLPFMTSGQFPGALGVMPMARYYFHIRDHDKLIRDPEGQDLVDEAAIRPEALASARELLAEAILLGESMEHRIFEVTDADGRQVATIPFRDAVDGVKR